MRPYSCELNRLYRAWSLLLFMRRKSENCYPRIHGTWPVVFIKTADWNINCGSDYRPTCHYNNMIYRTSSTSSRPTFICLCEYLNIVWVGLWRRITNRRLSRNLVSTIGLVNNLSSWVLNFEGLNYPGLVRQYYGPGMCGMAVHTVHE